MQYSYVSRQRWSQRIALVLVLMFIVPLFAQAQVVLQRSVLGGGGGLIGEGDVQLFSAIGQGVSGETDGSDMQLRSGFWAQRGTSANGGGGNSTIAVEIDHNHRPLDPVTLEIRIGDSVLPIEGLYGVGFKLHYEAGRIDAQEGSLIAGPFISEGDAPLSFEAVDIGAGVISASVTRTNGEGVSGNGIVAIYQFQLPDPSPAGSITFSLSDILAIDGEGNQIPLTPIDGTTYVQGVWPGDTDNNCVVDAADVLPIGVAFDATGPPRPGGFDISWSAKSFHAWSPSEYAFIDATGDGVVSQNDVLPIGLNYQLSRTTPDCTTNAAKQQTALAEITLPPADIGSQLRLRLNADRPLSDLLGIAFKLPLPSDVLTVKAVAPGALLNDGDLLAFDRYNAQTGLLDAAFTRKGTNPPANGTGTLVEIQIEVVATMTAPLTLALTSLRLSAADGTVTNDPPAVTMTAESDTNTATEEEAGTPTTFQLHGAYPNPFNPATTLSFDLPQAAEVTVLVYDVLGREVRKLAAGQMAAGHQQKVRFEATGLASGTYLYRVLARSTDGTAMQMGRFVLLK